MLIELGHAALAAAFGAALLQAISLWPRLRLAGGATGAAWTQFAALGVSFLALVGAFLGSDFSAELVASNSHTIKPLIYKASAAWGNHEGSMLLWTLVLAAYGAFLARDAKLDPGLRRTAIGVVGALSLGAVLFLLIASNPFERLDPAPIEGRGLNPLLQDPALAIHPPILYSGYVGFAAPYAVAVAALGRRCVDRAAADAEIRWSLVPLGLVTLGGGGEGLGDGLGQQRDHVGPRRLAGRRAGERLEGIPVSTQRQGQPAGLHHQPHVVGSALQPGQ